MRPELVLLLAVVAAFGFAASAFLQQRASRHLEGHPGLRLARKGLPGAARLLAMLFRSPAWFFGWFVNLLAFLVQALALHLGSVAVVQPIMTTQILFTVWLASWSARRRPTRRDVVAGLAICGGVGLMMVVNGASPIGGQADRALVLVVTLIAAGAVAVLVAASRFRPSPTLAAVLLACASGVCFAMSAMFVKLTGDDLLHHGVVGTATDWFGYALAVSTSLGLALGQLSHAAGPLPWSVSAMSIVNPLASYVAGCIAFHAKIPTDPLSLAGLAGAGALLIVGVVGLAHSPSVAAWAPSEDDPVDDGWGHPVQA